MPRGEVLALKRRLEGGCIAREGRHARCVVSLSEWWLSKAKERWRRRGVRLFAYVGVARPSREKAARNAD